MDVLNLIVEFISKMVGSILEFLLSAKTLTLLYSLRIYLAIIVGVLMIISFISERFDFFYFIDWRSSLMTEVIIGIVCLSRFVSRKVNTWKRLNKK